MSEHTAQSLPLALASLFRLNHYEVEAPVQLHGAEIDLVARPFSDPFGVPIYVEATTEYVDNDKYGKDVGKLALVQATNPNARCLIVSSKGFSLPVRERANATRIETLTYDELFAKFERFDPYLQLVLGDTPLATRLHELDRVYEEPHFYDSLGEELALDYLNVWRADADPAQRWLIVVGEYGTGKTALTRILQRRWAQDYKTDPQLPVPFRLELRDFTRQFDARGLVHHFLDHNRLGHLPIDFVFSLIRSGRIMLLLDGYDEMAQYLSARERRACLEALAGLSADGAKGIVTSRPNYFSEAEELQVFDLLYSSLETSRYYLSEASRARIRQEAEVDQLIEAHILDRFERRLRDLSPGQTESLVRNMLSDDPDGQQVILDVLGRVFRTADDGAAVSLSGKPVIVAYLLEVVEQLKGPVNLATTQRLTEWDIYRLIIDQLMLRDLERSQRLSPDRRRLFLQRLAVWLSERGHSAVGEEELRHLIEQQFSRELRLRKGTARETLAQEYVDDVRSSTTLTRSYDPSLAGWRFSHNSLREFLAAEYLTTHLAEAQIPVDVPPVTDGMRLLVASMPTGELDELAQNLGVRWGERSSTNVGPLLVLLWDGLLRAHADDGDGPEAVLRRIVGDAPAFNGVRLSRLSLPSPGVELDLTDAIFSESELDGVGLRGARLRSADFSDAILDSVDFVDADLTGARFGGAILSECDLRGADVTAADFRRIEADSSILVWGGGRRSAVVRLEGQEALGYLKYAGALTDPINPYFVAIHDKRFPIVEKIILKLAEQGLRQRRGLVQRGAARQDVPFAEEVLAHFESRGLVKAAPGRGELVEATTDGRKVFGAFIETRSLGAVGELFDDLFGDPKEARTT